MSREEPTISVMILFKNEIDHLKRIVPKVVEAFDDVVLVTNLEPNTDGSDEYLEQMGIRPHRMKWSEDFAAARQFGLNRCRGDYTMWMDCDDDIVTSCASWGQAREEMKSYLVRSKKDYYLGRVYHPNLVDYWERENWFHRDMGVRVKYPTHESYICTGEWERIPAGIIDRANIPLKPDYRGKLWRYFDMLYKYSQEVDNYDPRVRFYLQREFRGPAVARLALMMDYFECAHNTTKYRSFSEESWATFDMFDLRRAIKDPADLRKAIHSLVERYPMEFLPQVLLNMYYCEYEPSEQSGRRFYQLIKDRAGYQAERTPFTLGWYYDNSLNCCGYYLWRCSLHTRSRDLAQMAVDVLREADRPDCVEYVSHLVKSNRDIAERWLAGFRETE